MSYINGYGEEVDDEDMPFDLRPDGYVEKEDTTRESDDVYINLAKEYHIPEMVIFAKDPKTGELYIKEEVSVNGDQVIREEREPEETEEEREARIQALCDAPDAIVIDQKAVVQEQMEAMGIEVPQKKKKRMPVNIQNEIKLTKMTEQERKELEALYMSSNVLDILYDDYHLPEEEKRKKHKFYEKFTALNKCKRKYRDIVSFAKVYRITIDCLKSVATEAPFVNPHDFVKKVIRGEIHVNGLFFPKYIGKDKNRINWDIVFKYIGNTNKDLSELAKMFETVDEDAFFDDDDVSWETHPELFTEEEIESLKNYKPGDNDKPYLYSGEKPGHVYNYIGSEKSDKWFEKHVPGLAQEIKAHVEIGRKRSKKYGYLDSYVYSMQSSDFNKISEYDEKYGYESDSDMPKFKGDVTNKEDILDFEYDVKQYIDKTKIITPYGQTMTVEEARDQEIMQAFEDSGVNTRALFAISRNQEKKKKKKMDKITKKEAKKVENYKDKLVGLKVNQKIRDGELSEKDLKDPKKKKKIYEDIKKEIKFDVKDEMNKKGKKKKGKKKKDKKKKNKESE